MKSTSKGQTMQHKLNVRAFFFNAKTDYLPYYKNFTMTLEEDDTAQSILVHIKEQNKDFAYPAEKLIFKLNDLVVDGNETIGSIVAKLGTSLQVDPVLSYRSNHCLIINDEDFMKSYALLAPYAIEGDKAYYESLYATHYASETFKFSHDYIGDAILLLAHRMIENGSEYKEDILQAVSDPYDGLSACEYENNLFHPQDHAAAIETLNSMISHPNTSSFLDKMATTLSKKALYSFEKESLEGVQVACYAGNTSMLAQVHEKIIESHAKVTRFPREIKSCGRSLIGKQNNLAYLKAATTLLEALDAGAELLVVTDIADLEIFMKHFASIQKRIGREIPLPLVSYEAFLDLCENHVETVES